jgi:uncharacterized protein (TIGR02757 family)
VPQPTLKHALDDIYARYASRRWVHPDPLEFLYCYDSVQDREIAGLVAACLAYGNVQQILRSVEQVLGVLGPWPRAWLLNASEEALADGLAGFKHRWTTAEDVHSLLHGTAHLLRRHGSLEAAFARHRTASLTDALGGFVHELQGDRATGLLPDPCRGSACKRLHLYLRWMVRRDAVDPGGWKVIDPADLIVPLDVHMHRIALRLGLTQRRQADFATALEVTEGFGKLVPTDPVRYDFALTRLGIQRLEIPPELLRAGGASGDHS